MAKLLKLRRGTTSQHGSFTGAEGEVTIDTTKDTAVVHDGAQAGGRPLAREDMSNVSSASIAGRLGADSIAVTKIAAGTLPSDVKVTDSNVSGNLTITSADIVDGSIVNADVSGSAAIAGTKISPDFGSQTISTTGKLDIGGSSGAAIEVPHNRAITLGNAGEFYLIHAANYSQIKETGSDNLYIDSNYIYLRDANAQTKLQTSSGGIGVTGDITVTGTVDGRDVASDGSKLDGIESGATGDQTAAEIRTLVESASDSNVFTNADHTKLNGIESGATADQTAAEIRTLVESASDSNVFTNADHSKLNGIESGATADQSASEILTAIKTVDGSGSGLDADVLDGLDSSQFLRSDADDTINATLTTRRINVQSHYDIRLSGGNWTGEASAKIQHHSNNLYCQYPDAGSFRVRDSAGNDNFVVDSSGNATAAGNVTAYSDARLKTDIHTINDALGICGKLRGVSYKWIRDNKPSIGVIAQEVEEVIPEVVLTSHDLNPTTGESMEVKSVDYGKIVGVLINAINELKAEVDELKGGK